MIVNSLIKPFPRCQIKKFAGLISEKLFSNHVLNCVELSKTNLSYFIIYNHFSWSLIKVEDQILYNNYDVCVTFSIELAVRDSFRSCYICVCTYQRCLIVQNGSFLAQCWLDTHKFQHLLVEHIWNMNKKPVWNNIDFLTR